MSFNWRDFRSRHPRLLAALIGLKRMRTKVGLSLFLLCLAAGLYRKELPFDLDEVNVWVLLGLTLVIAGTALRLAALGCIRKHEQLATTGVYSLCRHPLYLGSILITYGFCVLLNSPANFIVATAYFVVFYPLAIAWEEIRLAESFGDAHDHYCKTTPLLLPMGRLSERAFQWRCALQNGALTLLVTIALLLCVVEVMAKLFRP